MNRVPEIREAVDPELGRIARDFCRDCSMFSDYVRGQAELLIDATPGLTQDAHKMWMIEWLIGLWD